MASNRTVQHAAIYARISKDPQGYAVGVHDQYKRCRELIAQRWPSAEITGIDCGCNECQQFEVPPDVYCDNDITASGKKRRPHYERLLADIEAGRVDVVVAVHTDRLHRNLTELEGYIDACEKHQTETHTVKAGELDLTTSSGRMVARMLGAAARHELERMTERQRAAKQRTRDAGIRSGGIAPFGYHLDQRDERGQQIPGVSRGMVPDPVEEQAIRDGCKKVLAGATTYSIAAEWNARGLRTRAQNWAKRPGDSRLSRPRNAGGYQGLWSPRSVQLVLTNPAIAGLIMYNGQVAGNAAWEPIVTPDTWRAVTAILTAPSRRVSPGPKPRHLLTGILECGVCGGHYFKCVQQSGGRGLAYVCTADSRFPGRTGGHTSRNAAKLDAYIEEIIVERLSRPDVVAALNTRPEVDVPALEARRVEITAELAEIAALRFSYRQRAEMSAPLLDEEKQINRQISDALRGDPLPEFRGKDPAKVWAALKADANIERMRAIAAALLRVRLHKGRAGIPKGWHRGEPVPLDYDSIEILPPDA